jgi:D-3-phosphoglycerate dehydrogenase / 2-oxoglutarate reductase
MAVTCPNVVQTLTENELIKLVPNFDVWIIGDDPATFKVFKAGKKGKLRVAIKWGVGIDNVDFAAATELGIRVQYTPGMFGNEVADIAVGYLICLARHIHTVDRGVKEGKWLKPCGTSLQSKKVCLIGFGDVGKSVAKRLLAMDMNVWVSDPQYKRNNAAIQCLYTDNYVSEDLFDVNLDDLDECLKKAWFVIITCSLNSSTKYMINKEKLMLARRGVRVINVARGPIIHQKDLCDLLDSGHVGSAALDVFESEPLPSNSRLHKYSNCIFGSHNASNTQEAVDRTSNKAIDLCISLLDLKQLKK